MRRQAHAVLPAGCSALQARSRDRLAYRGQFAAVLVSSAILLNYKIAILGCFADLPSPIQLVWCLRFEPSDNQPDSGVSGFPFTITLRPKEAS